MHVRVRMVAAAGVASLTLVVAWPAAPTGRTDTHPQPSGFQARPMAGGVAGIDTSAQPGWSEPQRLLPRGRSVTGAGNRRGLEGFVWQVDTNRFRRDPAGYSGNVSFVRARLRLPNGRLTRPQNVSRTDQIVRRPQVGLDGRGTVIAAWAEAVRGRSYAIMVAIRRPGGRFGAPARLGRTLDFEEVELRLAVDRGGRAAVLWNYGPGLKAALKQPGRCPAGRPRSCFGRAQDLGNGFNQTVTFGRRGKAHAAWAETPWSNERGIYLSIARPGRSFGSPRRISPRGLPASQPTIAVSRDGTTAVAWRRSPPTTPAEDIDGPIDVVVREPDGPVHAPQTLALPADVTSGEPSTATFRRPQVHLNRLGEAVLVWEFYSPDGDYDGVAVAVRPRGGTFGSGTAISPPGIWANWASLAIDARGNAIVSWSAGGARIDANVRPPGGSFGDSAIIGSAAAGVPVTVTAGDTVTVAWPSRRGTWLSDWAP